MTKEHISPMECFSICLMVISLLWLSAGTPLQQSALNSLTAANHSTEESDKPDDPIGSPGPVEEKTEKGSSSLSEFLKAGKEDDDEKNAGKNRKRLFNLTEFTSFHPEFTAPPPRS